MTTNIIHDDNGNYSIQSGTPSQIIELAASILESRIIGETLNSPEASTQFIQMKIGSLEHEVFMVVYLDNRHRVIAAEELFRGTINGASVHPREVVKETLKHNAAAVILAHNHPSGIADPSEADKRLTSRLKDALSMVDVRVLDHIIVSPDETFSMAERGLV